MSKKLVSVIITVGFILILVIMAAIMIKGLIDQNNDEDAQIARYESLKTEGGKTTLTIDIMEEDHTKYVEDAAQAKKTFITLLVLFGAAFLWIVVTSIFRLVLKGMQEGAGRTFLVMAVSFVIASIVFGIGIYGFINFLVPRLGSDVSKEGYYFTTLSLVDSERKEEVIETGTGDDRHSTTHVYYYLIEDDGNKLQVSKILYDRYYGPGEYYAGQTAKGNIFSLYPDIYFELETQ